MELCMSRAADFAFLLTNSEKGPERQRKLLNKVVEVPFALASRDALTETRETAETQVVRDTRATRKAGASTTGQDRGLDGWRMAPHALH